LLETNEEERMRVVVLKEIPRGRESVTLQYVGYLALRFCAVQMEIRDVAPHLHGLARDPERFDAVIASVYGPFANTRALRSASPVIHSPYERGGTT
jgi:hypothetical protein